MTPTPLETIMSNISSFVTWFVTQVLSVFNKLVANPYFLTAIILCISILVIGIILKFFKSFGLKRGGKRRGR